MPAGVWVKYHFLKPHSLGDSIFPAHFRGGSRAAAACKMERFVIIVHGFQPLTIITKRSICGCCSSLRSASAFFDSVIKYLTNKWKQTNLGINGFVIGIILLENRNNLCSVKFIREDFLKYICLYNW